MTFHGEDKFKKSCLISSTILIALLKTCTAGVTPMNASAGHHCSFLTKEGDNLTMNGTININNATTHYLCVQCMFPQNCLANGKCRIGSGGNSCEKCLAKYERVGNSCVRCPSFPWSLVGFAVYCLVLVVTSLVSGFTTSVCTKVKQVCHYLQLLILTFHIKLPWPDPILQVLAPVNFALFTSSIIGPECLLADMGASSQYYLEWLTAFTILIAILVLGVFVDKNLVKYLICKPEGVKQATCDADDAGEGPEKRTLSARQKKTTWRRFVVMVILVMYAPVTLAAIRSFLCSDTVPLKLVLDRRENVFLLDNDIKCTEFVFQSIHFLGTFLLIVVGVMLPLAVLFFTLRQKKWDLLYTHWILYSPVYESYTDRCCFWEVLPLLRKLISIVVTEAYPFPPFIQSMVQLGMSGLYLLLVVVIRPFRPCYWKHSAVNLHCIFEVVCTLVLLVIQGVGVAILQGYHHQVLDTVASVILCVPLALWLGLMITVPLETDQQLPVEQFDIVEEPKEKKRKPDRRFWKKSNRVDQDPEYIERVNKNIGHVDF